MNNKKNKSFAIITAYRYQDNEGNFLSKKDNNRRNRSQHIVSLDLE